MLYTLMHRDIPVMDLELDEYSNIVSLGKIHHAEHLPLGTYNKIGVERKAQNNRGEIKSLAPFSTHLSALPLLVSLVFSLCGCLC